MYLTPADQMLLPLAVIDVNQFHSHRPTHVVPVRSSRPSRPTVAARIGANVVRLIPGRTRLQFGLGAR